MLRTRALAAVAASILAVPLAAQQRAIPIESLLSAPFPSNLSAAPAGGVMAWVQNDRGVRNVLAVLGQRANVAHVHPHRFRHDTARRLVEAVDLPTVAALLGHSRLDSVRIYAQPDEAALERATAALEKA